MRVHWTDTARDHLRAVHAYVIRSTSWLSSTAPIKFHPVSIKLAGFSGTSMHRGATCEEQRDIKDVML